MSRGAGGARARLERLTRAGLRDHLLLEEPAVRRLVLTLRDAVLRAAPTASEGVKFGALSYFHGGAFFKSIGGNICMIEVKSGAVLLSFIRGAQIPDPDGLLRGKGTIKRFVPIADEQAAKSAAVARLVRAAAALEPWE